MLRCVMVQSETGEGDFFFLWREETVCTAKRKIVISTGAAWSSFVDRGRAGKGGRGVLGDGGKGFSMKGP